jgi:hypothetical protein
VEVKLLILTIIGANPTDLYGSKAGLPIVKINDFASTKYIVLPERLPVLDCFETGNNIFSLTVVVLLR